MDHVGPANEAAGKEVLLVGCQRLLDTVRGHHDGSGEVRKLLMLVLPGSTVMPVKVLIFLQAGISMGRKHFSMSVDIDTLAFTLLQYHLEVLQIVAGDKEGLPLLRAQRNFGRHRMSVCACICSIKNLHGLEVDLTTLKHESNPVVQSPLSPCHGCQ